MNGTELLRCVELIHREKDIPREAIFSNIEKGIRLAILKAYDDDEGVTVTVDRSTGIIEAKRGEEPLDPEALGRIAAVSAKNLMIQGFREVESESVFNQYTAQKGDLVQGTVQRFDGGACTVSLGKAEAILPRGEQIPGETHHVGERVKAIILEVRKAGHRVKIILSRTHPDFVRRLFEEEIPEIQDGTISIRAVAREAGYRSKVAVSSIDTKVDCVGACVGVRGSRIKNIVDELGGERIDIVRWNDSLQVLIQYALQPAQIEEVMLYHRLGRAIVLVKEDQLSLAIGRRGQNVRLASKLVQRDIEIMTHDELGESLERAEAWFREIPNITDQQVETFIEEGFLSYDDLTFLEVSDMAELAGVSEEEAEEIIAFAEEAALRVEKDSQRIRELEGNAPAARPSATEAAVRLLGGDTEMAPAETLPTAETLLGPAVTPEQSEATPEGAGQTSAAEQGAEAPATATEQMEAPASEGEAETAAAGGEEVPAASGDEAAGAEQMETAPPPAGE
jgi:N utilization substance protein A